MAAERVAPRVTAFKMATELGRMRSGWNRVMPLLPEAEALSGLPVRFKMAAPSGGFPPRERRGGEREEDYGDVVAPKRPRFGAGSKIGGRRLIVVLEGASLETVKVTCKSLEREQK